MKANYKIKMEFDIEYELKDGLKDLKSQTELATNIGQLVCDEVATADGVAIYGIINACVNVS